ncbi:MAG: response regulator [Anaerolineales bacterium]|jgi:CheY-like chemotaxis protein|nr:response regulator [Anaerolineales bacterium]
MTKRILIVDDQREVSRLLRSALETIEQGLDVSEAPSGEEALLEASRVSVDLLVVDYRLPGMSGLELMQKMRARYPEMKIIIISGVSEPKTRADIGKAGADAFFTKPVPMADFLDAVERSLGLARTILQSSAEPEPEDNQTLADLLVGIRKDLAADAVFLLDSLGHVQAEAGQLPDTNHKVSLISSLMGMHNAAQKAASLLGKSNYHLHLFDCDEHDLVFIPLGKSHVLWVVGRGLADLLSISKTINTLNASKQKIVEIFEQIEGESPVEEPIPHGIPAFMESATIPLEFEELLRKVPDNKIDANAFWDQALEQGPQYTEPDKLTYEQAAQLGLAPKNGDAD